MKHMTISSLLLALLCGITLQASQWNKLRTTQDQRDFEDADTEIIELNEPSVDELLQSVALHGLELPEEEADNAKPRESVVPTEELKDLLSDLRSTPHMRQQAHDEKPSNTDRPTWLSTRDIQPGGKSHSQTNSPVLPRRRERSKTFGAPTVSFALPQEPSSLPKEERKSPRLFGKKLRSPRSSGDGPGSPSSKPRSFRIKRRQQKTSALSALSGRRSDNPKTLEQIIPQQKRRSLDLVSDTSVSPSSSTLSKSSSIIAPLRRRSPRYITKIPPLHDDASESTESTSPTSPSGTRRAFSEHTKKNLEHLKQSTPEVKEMSILIGYLTEQKGEGWVRNMYEKDYSTTSYGGIEVSEETFFYLYDKCIQSLASDTLSPRLKEQLSTVERDPKSLAIYVLRNYINNRVDGAPEEAPTSPSRRVNKSPRNKRSLKK